MADLSWLEKKRDRKLEAMDKKNIGIIGPSWIWFCSNIGDESRIHGPLDWTVRFLTVKITAYPIFQTNPVGIPVVWVNSYQ